MRGRKQDAAHGVEVVVDDSEIKKESPNEGTETRVLVYQLWLVIAIKKESPNEGTETVSIKHQSSSTDKIKKESPNEGTETTDVSRPSIRKCIPA